MKMPSLRAIAKKAVSYPAKIRRSMYRKMPALLGHQILADLVQFYRNDSLFETAVSFSNFVEFYTDLQTVEISFSITAYNKTGSSLGKKILIVRRGASQIELRSLFPNLDSEGLFIVSMNLNQKFFREVEYLGALSPQFMTLYIPKDEISAPQMVHSHKKAQGHLIRRNVCRMSADIENSQVDREMQLYAINSCRSRLKVEISVGTSGSNRISKEVSIPAYGCSRMIFASTELSELKSQYLSISYKFDRAVDHMKPILFRQLPSGAWSCNHT